MAHVPGGRYRGGRRAQLVAWMCLCSRCGDRGYVEVQDRDHPGDPFFRQCEVCNGVKREPIPLPEVMGDLRYDRFRRETW